ncbi:MAG: hypothetical protein MI919_04420, partial [Holophagales bacterium]|nr:hypothetical protein [Holophagales bacterium]
VCLNGGRFEVSATWQNLEGEVEPANIASSGSADSGLLWFLDPDNWEILVKVLDACAVNDRFWMFSAATTNLGYTLRVADSQTGRVRIYDNAPGEAAPSVNDTDGFATCP